MNRFKNVKSFIKDKGHVDQYPQISVKFIGGHNPDLVIYDDNKEEIERIDLTKYDKDGTEALHALVKNKGFLKAGDPKFDEL